MDRPEVRKIAESNGEQRKMEKTGCEIICGAPTTLAVKGLMMMIPRALLLMLKVLFGISMQSFSVLLGYSLASCEAKKGGNFGFYVHRNHEGLLGTGKLGGQELYI